VSYRVTDRDRVTFLAFGSYDSISARDDESTDGGQTTRGPLEEILSIQFHRFDLRWDRKTSDTGSLQVAVTAGFDKTGSQAFSSRAMVGGARVLAKEELTKAIRLRVGADVWGESYRFSIPTSAALEPTDGSSAGTQRDLNIGAWVDSPLRFGSHVDVVPGLRTDIFTSRAPAGAGDAGPTAKAVPAVDPRLSTRVHLGPIDILGGVGMAHQPSTLPIPIPALSFAQLKYGLQTGYHLSQGIEAHIPAGFTASATGYLHRYTGIIDLAAHCPNNEVGCTESVGQGKSAGIELLVKREVTRAITGSVAYTYSHTTRDAWDPNTQRRATVDAQFDRPHVFNGVLSIRLGRGFMVGGRYMVYSGVPYSTTGNLGVPNARTPSFNRVDFRLEKRWRLGEGRSLGVTLELLNALLQKEAIGIECSAVNSCHPQAIGPITVPSVGVEGTL
jgi:hypothetical protein